MGKRLAWFIFVLPIALVSCDSGCVHENDELHYIALDASLLNWFDSLESGNYYNLNSDDSLSDYYKVIIDTNAITLDNNYYDCYTEITLGQNYEINYIYGYINPLVQIKFGYVKNEYQAEFIFKTNYWTPSKSYFPSRIELDFELPYRVYSYPGWNSTSSIRCDTCFVKIGEMTVKEKTFHEVYKITDLQAVLNGIDYANTEFWVDRHFGLIKSRSKNGRNWYVSFE